MKRFLQYVLVVAATAVIAACGGGGGIPLYIPNSSALTVTTTSLPAATVGADYSLTLTATGGAPPYKWSTMGGDPLPAGLTLNQSTGVLSGTPTTTGTANVIFMVTDTNPATMVHQTLTITVVVYGTPAITTTVLPAASVGTAYSQTLTATGGTPPYKWSTMPSNTYPDPLPAGLTLNATTGVLSGTPTTAGTANVQFMLQDANPTTMIHKVIPVTVTAVAPPYVTPSITTTTLPAASVGVAYNQTLTATGGTTPYKWATMGGDPLPAGLTLNASTGVLSGTPTTAGTANVQFMLQDSNPNTMIHKVIPVTVNAAVLPGQAVYDNNCSGCHKLGTYDPNGYAPNLSAKGGLVPIKFPTPGVAGHNGITLSAQQITDVSAFLNAN